MKLPNDVAPEVPVGNTVFILDIIQRKLNIPTATLYLALIQDVIF